MYTNQEFHFYSKNFTIEDVRFIPMNKFFVDFKNVSFKYIENSEQEVKINAVLRFERYLNGNFSIADGSQNILNKKKCIVLPLEQENHLLMN